MIHLNLKEWDILLGRISKLESKMDKIIWLLENNQVNINRYPEPKDYDGHDIITE